MLSHPVRGWGWQELAVKGQACKICKVGTTSCLQGGSPILASSDITPTQIPEPGLQVWLGLPRMAFLGLEQNSRTNRRQRYIPGPLHRKGDTWSPYFPFLSPTSWNQIKLSLKLDISEIRLVSARLSWAGLVTQNNKTHPSIAQHFQHPP